MTERQNCPGQCNAKYRRAEAARQNAIADRRPAPEHGVEPEPGQPYWCETCTNLIRTGLVRLDNLAAAAGRRRDGRLPTPAPAVRSSVGRDPASPSAAWDTVDEIAQWAARWEETARSLLGQHPWGATVNHRLHKMTPVAVVGRTVHVVGGLSSSAGYLARVHKRILERDDVAVVFGKELLALVARVERQTGLDDTVTRLQAPCPKCDLVALQRRDGSERVECRYCHHDMSMTHYEQWARMSVAEQQAIARGWKEPA